MSVTRPSAPPEPLLAACRTGDRKAFAELFTLCRDRVYSLSLHLPGEEAAAGDVTQDVFMKLLTRLPQLGVHHLALRVIDKFLKRAMS